MKYIISERVILDPDLNTLSLVNNDEKMVTISNPVKRLLELLIVYHGENVCREVIFQKVWDDFGMISSNNNLNHCVSKLRRTLKDFGIEDEIIVTIPKLGFVLHKDTAIRTIPDNHSDVSDVPLAMLSPMPASRSAALTVAKKADSAKYILTGRRAVLSVCVFFLFIACGIIVWTQFFLREHSEVSLGTVEGCKISLHHAGLEKDKQAAIRQSVQKYIIQNNIHCAAQEYIGLWQAKNPQEGNIQLHLLRCGLQQAVGVEICSGISLAY